MQRFVFLLLLILLILPRLAFSTVRFDWSDSGASEFQKKQVIEIFKRVAVKYLDPGYCQLGPIDFFNVKEEYIIWWDPKLASRQSESWASGDIGGSTLSLSLDLLNSPNALEALFAHELEHLYDRTMTDRLFHPNTFKTFPTKYKPKIRRSQINSWIHDYLYGAELRAVNKEMTYLKTMRHRMEDNEFNRLTSRIIEVKNHLENN